MYNARSNAFSNGIYIKNKISYNNNNNQHTAQCPTIRMLRHTH